MEDEDSSGISFDKLADYGLAFFKASQGQNQQATAPAPAAPEKTYGGFTVTQLALGAAGIVVLLVLVSLFRK